MNSLAKEDAYMEISKRIRERKPRMAICYDFDKTLSPDDMQTFTLIPSFGINKEEFWGESNSLAKTNLMDNNLAWMYELIKYSNFKGKSLKRDYFREIGADVKLYKGVEKWFIGIVVFFVILANSIFCFQFPKQIGLLIRNI